MSKQAHSASTNGDSVGSAGRLLTPGEAAERLRVKVSWLYQHTRRRSQDRIPFGKVGHYVRFREEDLQTYISQRIVRG